MQQMAMLNLIETYLDVSFALEDKDLTGRLGRNHFIPLLECSLQST